MPNGLKKLFDETFGPPGEAIQAIKEISESLSTIDESKLRLVRSVIESVGKVKGSPEELKTFLEIMKLISSATPEQLTAIRDITGNLVKLVRYLPKEGLKGLPISEIVKEFRKS